VFRKDGDGDRRSRRVVRARDTILPARDLLPELSG
jgi:hypothetical protein